MTISEQKPFEEIVEELKEENKIFLIGCAQCATLCQAGGEDQVKEMKEKLEKEGKKVTGWLILDPACHLLEDKRKFREKKKELEEAEAILSLACGDGTQTIQTASGKITHPGLNTLFLGEISRFGEFHEKCSLCAECVLDKTGGLCPITLCTKSLLNGPCGGQKEGKCEVDPEKDCGWALIYERLKELNQLEKMKEMHSAKDYSKIMKPRTLILERRKG
jgi:hypothetical protein